MEISKRNPDCKLVSYQNLTRGRHVFGGERPRMLAVRLSTPCRGENCHMRAVCGHSGQLPGGRTRGLRL